MKKLIFLGVSVAMMVGCSSNISNSDQLLGSWHCTIHYDDFNIRTVDNLNFSEKGELSNQGTISYPIHKPIFVYDVLQKGQWSLKGNTVTYRILSETILRNHREDVVTELKRDHELKQFEENLFSSFSDDTNNNVIELTITDFEAHEMEIQQEIKRQNIYKGQCIKQ